MVEQLESRVFTGFDSATPGGRLYDEDLIIRDLLNHFYTRKTERIMQPEYGTVIWDLLFEHKSEFVTSQIRDDIKRIIESDSRVQLNSLELIEQEHGYIANITLYFNRINLTKELQINFNQNIAQKLETE